MTVSNGNAQNLVPNGSFENFLAIPNGSGQCTEATSWKSAGGTPDYFHQSASLVSGVNIPHTFAGELNKAYEGVACAGLCSYMTGVVNYREYLSCKLDTVLTIGETYTVTLYCLSNTSPLYYGGVASDNLGVAFSKQKLQQSTDGVIHYTPQCLLASQFYSYAWKKLSFEFVADSAYKRLTIGCFVDDSIQQRQLINSALLFDCAYTFIDNVSVEMKPNATTGIAEENYTYDTQATYTDILGKPANYQKGLLIAKKGNKYQKIYVQ